MTRALNGESAVRSRIFGTNDGQARCRSRFDARRRPSDLSGLLKRQRNFLPSDGLVESRANRNQLVLSLSIRRRFEWIPFRPTHTKHTTLRAGDHGGSIRAQPLPACRTRQAPPRARPTPSTSASLGSRPADSARRLKCRVDALRSISRSRGCAYERIVVIVIGAAVNTERTPEVLSGDLRFARRSAPVSPSYSKRPGNAGEP